MNAANNRFAKHVIAAFLAAVAWPSIAFNAQLAGQEIAGGHAFTKHAAELGLATQAGFAARAEQIIMQPSAVRYLSQGRVAYWDDVTKNVVIRNPSARDGGTMFKPTKGKAYFDEL